MKRKFWKGTVLGNWKWIFFRVAPCMMGFWDRHHKQDFTHEIMIFLKKKKDMTITIFSNFKSVIMHKILLWYDQLIFFLVIGYQQFFIKIIKLVENWVVNFKNKFIICTFSVSVKKKAWRVLMKGQADGPNILFKWLPFQQEKSLEKLMVVS